MASAPLLRLCLLPTQKPLPFPSASRVLFPNPLPETTKSKSKTLKTTVSVSRPRISMSYNPTPTPTPTPTPATDRLISVAAYTLPLFNSLQYGRYLLIQFPTFGLLLDPIVPLLSLYRSIPYSSFVAFFALYLGIVRNPSFSHYVRFNSMQAVTLDVLLVLPHLLHRIFTPGRAGIGFRVMVWGHNLLFVFSVMCFIYSVVSCVLGRTPHLPFVADAAARQI